MMLPTIEAPPRGRSAAAQSVDEFPLGRTRPPSIPTFFRLCGQVALGALPERAGRVPRQAEGQFAARCQSVTVSDGSSFRPPSLLGAGPVPLLSPLIGGESRTVTVGSRCSCPAVRLRLRSELRGEGGTEQVVAVGEELHAGHAGGGVAGRRCPADAGVYAVDVRPAELLHGDLGKPANEEVSADLSQGLKDIGFSPAPNAVTYLAAKPCRRRTDAGDSSVPSPQLRAAAVPLDDR